MAAALLALIWIRHFKALTIDNTAAYQAIEDSKALHARRWQTKEGIYRIKRQALPDVRDAPLHDDNAARVLPGSYERLSRASGGRSSRCGRGGRSGRK